MRNNTIVLIGCIAALLLRLLIASQAPTLAPEAYDTIRQAEHIAETGIPFRTDPLAPESGERVVFPVFPYLIAFGTILFGDYAYVLVPNLLAVLAHAALFFLVLELTQHRGLATIAMIASIFIPSYLIATTLTASSLSLALPLILIILTLFIKLRKSKEKRNLLLLITVLLLATAPIALIIVPVFLLALLLAAIRRARELTIQYEFAIFTTFFATWAYTLLYKNAIIEHGFRTIQGNIPFALLDNLYGTPDLLTFGLAVGVVPFGLAIYAAYKEGAAEHAGVQITIAFAVAAFAATIFELVPTHTGITIVAMACTVLAAVGLEWLVAYAKTMRGTTLPRVATTIAIVAFIATSIIPTVVAGLANTRDTIPLETLHAATWLRENSLPEAIVVTQPAWGAAVAWASERPVFSDGEYLADTDSDERYRITTAVLEGSNLKIIAEEERIEYIITDGTITNPCLNTVYDKGVVIMKVLC